METRKAAVHRAVLAKLGRTPVPLAAALDRTRRAGRKVPLAAALARVSKPPAAPAAPKTSLRTAIDRARRRQAGEPAPVSAATADRQRQELLAAAGHRCQIGGFGCEWTADRVTVRDQRPAPRTLAVCGTCERHGHRF